MKMSAEILSGTAVRPKGSTIIKWNSMVSNFIQIYRCFHTFQTAHFYSNRNLCPGCCYSRSNVLGFSGQRFSILRYESLLLHQAERWLAKVVRLSPPHPRQLETEFLSSVFQIWNSESFDSKSFTFSISINISDNPSLSIDRIRSIAS